MDYHSLAEFVQVLQCEGELSRIAYPVRPVPEISEIADRVMKSGGPTRLFENVVDKQIPVLLCRWCSRKIHGLRFQKLC
ncbi:MAG TPA: hypothetical protein VLJ79_11900 [Candidatus Binatia bacterium]|nr:hypothetical protein [Candidatus Binatia bacterium]